MYDLLDLGAGRGDSLLSCSRAFRTLGILRSIGIDRDRKKVLLAQKAGHNVHVGDITDHTIKSCKSRIISMCDFLEHLPNKEAALSMLRAAVESANEFVFVRHPSFEKEDVRYLAKLGLRLTWYTWHGHTARLQFSDIISSLNKIANCRVYAIVNGWVKATTNGYVVPITAPDDCIAYTNLLGKKPAINNFRPIMKHVDILVTNKKFPHWPLAISCAQQRLEHPRIVLYNKTCK